MEFRSARTDKTVIPSFDQATDYFDRVPLWRKFVKQQIDTAPCSERQKERLLDQYHNGGFSSDNVHYIIDMEPLLMLSNLNLPQLRELARAFEELPQRHDYTSARHTIQGFISGREAANARKSRIKSTPG